MTVSPDEGELFSIHGGIQNQTRVLPEGRNYQAEHQSNADKHSWQNDL